MHPVFRPLVSAGLAGCLVYAALAATPPLVDARGNSLRRSPLTGHVSNFDEAKVGAYVLPDPLVLANGQPVRDAATWRQVRRAEILALFEREVFGRVPAGAPPVTFTVTATDTGVLDRKAIRKHVVGRLGHGADAPKLALELVLPAAAKQPVPILINLSFDPATGSSLGRNGADGRPLTDPARYRPPFDDLLDRGWGCATICYTEFEGDSVATSLTRARRLALVPGQAKPAPDEWGTIAAWSWGVSRVIDFLVTQPEVDAQRLVVFGHSRLGKTALWAGATDPRIALVFSSCSGEGGAAIARRDFGETIDDTVANFPFWFAENFHKYAGKWNDLPVDAHLLIALCAPRPVFVTGGTRDEWADPKGEFLAVAAAGPVYRLLGAADVGTTEMPPIDHPLVSGDLGYLCHEGGHIITTSDWTAFFAFADRAFKTRR